MPTKNLFLLSHTSLAAEIIQDIAIAIQAHGFVWIKSNRLRKEMPFGMLNGLVE